MRNNLELLQPLSRSEKDYTIEQLRLYAQLLTAVFSIYFATIGIILSSGYTRLRRDIIQLLTTEQVGSVYSKVIVLSAIYCLTATSLPLFGEEPGYFIYTTATFLTIASSLALFPLGQRLFNFFDLNLLVHSEILPSIAKHIQGAVKSNSASLSNHHYRATRISLDQLSYIDFRLKNDGERLEDNLPALTDDYSNLLLHYLQKKNKIKQESYWFPRKQKHKNWFFVGDTATSISLQTSSQLTAEESTDLNWFEGEIVEKLSGHIEKAFECGNFELALKLISQFSSRISIYAKDLQFDLGMKELNNIREIIEVAFASNNNNECNNGDKVRTAIADTWAALGSNLSIETLRRMMTFDKEWKKFLANDTWSERSLHGLPTFLQVELSFIVQYIDFEHSVEGHRQSKPKYVQQLAMQKLLQRYAEILPAICEFHDSTVPGFATSLSKLGLSQAATQVILASLHSYWKLPRWLEKLAPLLGQYGSYEHYSEKHYALPKINVDSMTSCLSGTRDKAISLLANPDFVGHIFSSNHDDDIPDHFGQIYFELAEACINALEQNDEEKFGEIAPMFIALSLLASDSKFPDPELDVQDEFRLHLISAVINDLASVMGFAILYGSYFDNPKLPKAALRNFFSWAERATDKQQFLIRMIRLSESHRFSLSASPRSLIRINWKMSFEHRARQDGYGDQMGLGRETAHNNQIVNVFLKSHSDASHLFFATEVLPLITPVDFDISNQITSLAKQLQKEDVDADK